MESIPVVLAIESGVKLGRKVHDVLISNTVEAPLLLPVGDLYADLVEQSAIDFFLRSENVDLTAPNGPYSGYQGPYTRESQDVGSEV